MWLTLKSCLHLPTGGNRLVQLAQEKRRLKTSAQRDVAWHLRTGLERRGNVLALK